MGYGYYDYLENYYESYYDYYYEYSYWPAYYANYSYNGTYPPSQYQYVAPYNMDYITPPLFAVSVCCAVLALLITVLICYKIRQGKMRQTQTGTDNLTIGLTLFCALMHLGQNAIDPITYYAWFIAYDPDLCNSLYVAYDLFWCLAKISLYLLFIYRYYLIFKASTMMSAVSKSETYFVFGCFVITMVAQCCLYLVYMLLRYELIRYQDTDKGKRIWLNVCWAFLVIDTFLIGILGYLLAYSLLKLIVNINTLGGTLKEKDNTQSISVNSVAASKQSKIAVQLSEYVTENKEAEPTLSEQKSMDLDDADFDGADMRLFLLDYDLNDDEILNKMNERQIRFRDLANIEAADLNELCASLGLAAMQKIRFKSAVKELNCNGHWDKDAKDVGSMSSSSRYKSRKKKDKKRYKKYKSNRNKKLNDLMHTTTRIALTMIIAMISSFIYQFFWLLAYELEDWDMMWMAYTWCVDAVVNILCVYLSMGSALNHYKILCHDCCKLHQCTLGCIQKIIPDSKN